MLEIAGGILVALFVLALLLFGFGYLADGKKDEQGCGIALLLIAGIILWTIFT